MRIALNRVPSIPDAEWLDPESRFDHLARLLRQREPNSKFRPDLVATQLICRESGGPARAIPSNGPRAEGAYFSRKSQAFRYWEAPGEKKKMLICESDPLVEQYWHQPHTLHFPGSDQGFRSYTPDLEIHLSDGSTQIVEVKFDYADAVKDTAYIKKLLVARLHYAGLGRQMAIVTETEDLDGSVALANARTIAPCRHDMLSTLDLMRLSAHLDEQGGRSTLGAVCHCLQSHAQEHPAMSLRKALAAIARRKIGVDIHTVLLSPNTAVWTLSGRRAR